MRWRRRHSESVSISISQNRSRWFAAKTPALKARIAADESLESLVPGAFRISFDFTEPLKVFAGKDADAQGAHRGG